MKVGWPELVGGLLALVALVLALGALGFRFDPFDWTAKRAAAAEATAEVRADDAQARGEEVAAERELAIAVDARQRTIDRIEDKTHALDLATAADTAVDQALPPSLAARLREHDDFLCELRPAVCAASAPAGGDAGPGP